MDVLGAIGGKRYAGAGSGAGEEGPALACEVGAGGAEVVGFVEVVDLHTVVRWVMRFGTVFEEVGNEGGEGVVDANFVGECFGGETQGRMACLQFAEVCAGCYAKLRRRIKSEEQGGALGLGGAKEGIKGTVCELLCIINKKKGKTAGQGGRMHLAAGVDRPAAFAAKSALPFAKRRVVEDGCWFVVCKEMSGQIIQQERFAGAGRRSEGEAGVGVTGAFAKNVFFYRLLAGGEKILTVHKTVAVAER